MLTTQLCFYPWAFEGSPQIIFMTRTRENCKDIFVWDIVFHEDLDTMKTLLWVGHFDIQILVAGSWFFGWLGQLRGQNGSFSWLSGLMWKGDNIPPIKIRVSYCMLILLLHDILRNYLCSCWPCHFRICPSPWTFVPADSYFLSSFVNEFSPVVFWGCRWIAASEECLKWKIILSC